MTLPSSFAEMPIFKAKHRSPPEIPTVTLRDLRNKRRNAMKSASAVHDEPTIQPDNDPGDDLGDDDMYMEVVAAMDQADVDQGVRYVCQTLNALTQYVMDPSTPYVLTETDHPCLSFDDALDELVWWCRNSANAYAYLYPTMAHDVASLASILTDLRSSRERYAWDAETLLDALQHVRDILVQ